MRRRFQEFAARRNKTRYVLAGLLVGVLVGLIVSAFRFLIGFVLSWVVSAYQAMQANPWLILPYIAGTIVLGYILGLIVRSEPYIKGSGIPQVELQLQGHLSLNWWSILWKKFVAGGIAIGSGLFLGREGPSIQLGSAVGQGVAKVTKSNRVQENILISSGAGAGLAAAFNAPIAGLLFVLEEVHHSFSPTVALTTLTATVTANFISLHAFGNHPALDLGNHLKFPVAYYGYLVVLGIFLALFGWCYQRVTFALPRLYAKLVPWVKPPFYGIVAGLLIIPIGIVAPHIVGGGGELILELAHTKTPLLVLALILLVRFVFSMVSYGTGLPGGIFLPILSLGALVGALYGQFIINITGMDQELLLCFIFFAMAGGFAAIGKAPLTALLLVSEMVGGLNQLMPLAVVVLSAFLLAEALKMPPIYEALAEKMLHQEDLAKTGRRTTFEVPIFVDSPLVGQKVAAIKWPEDVLIATIRRGEKEYITKGKMVLQAGDILIALTDEGIVGHMHQAMTQLAMPAQDS